MGLTTNFIDGTTGLDIGESLLDKTYVLDRYPELEDTFKQAGLWTWGTNTSGELGTGDTSYYSSPVQTIAGGTNWKQVSCGGFGNISQMGAVKTDGTLWMWGYNFFGQLGTNDRVARSSPVQTVAVGTNWKQVACSSYQTAAIKTDGTLWLWGNNDYGQLGTNDTLRRSSPVQTVAGGTDWKQVASGYLNTAAIKTDGITVSVN
jgi:alpha-tubulin suppressor-like RCC1 family protein